MNKTVSQLDENGFFVGEAIADKSPMEEGVYLLPAGCLDRAPPANIEPGKRYRPWGAGWRGEVVPVEPEAPPPSAAELRRAAIVARLSAIDGETARPAREIALAFVGGQPAPAFAATKLQALESEAASLRLELAAL